MHYFLNYTKINKDDFYKSCKKVYEWWLFHIFCDKKICIMESSKLMEDLLVYMDNKINNQTNELKMVIDFGHDVTVAQCNFLCIKLLMLIILSVFLLVIFILSYIKK